MINGDTATSKVETYLAPGGEQAELIAEFSEIVKDLHGAASLRGPDGSAITIPTELFEILVKSAAELQRGRSVSIIPNERMLTTQEAAELLGISRPTLVKLLENGRIPFSKVGRHRRVQLSDLLDYQKQVSNDRLTLLREIASDTPDTETFYHQNRPLREGN